MFPFWQQYSRLARQNIFLILRIPWVHYRVHVNWPPTAVLTLLSQVHTLIFSFFNLRSSFIFQPSVLGLQSYDFPVGFTTKVSVYISQFFMRATYLAYLILFDLVAIVFSKE